MSRRDDDGELLVWDVFENAWVPMWYWRWVNGGGQ